MARRVVFSEVEARLEFLSVPAVGATELQVTDAVRNRQNFLESVVDDLLEDVVAPLIDAGDPASDTDTVSMVEVSWVGPNGPVTQIIMRPNAESHRELVIAARRLGVGIRYFAHNDGQFPRTRPVGVLCLPRHPGNIGKLQSEALIVDTPELFDVSIQRTDHPGVVARKVRRRKPVHLFFQVRQNATSTRIDHQTRSGLETVEFRNDQLVGIARTGHIPLAVTTEGILELPNMSYWSKVDFRGREFATWAYDKLLLRLGL